jgi:uncharacterized protein (TIGR00251 family)
LIQVRPAQAGAVFGVKARPGAPRSAVQGEWNGLLKVAVAAPPEDGRANEELIRFLARGLDVPRSSLELTAGAGARTKRILVRGLDAGGLAARLERLIRDPADSR